MADPDFTIGIEEEYLLVDPASGHLSEAPPAMMDMASKALAGQFSPEFKACQVEVGTRVCRTAAEARDDLKNLRAKVKEIAAEFDLAPIAVSCHPFADWKDQGRTDHGRYNQLEQALGGVARRMLISGMHIHVGLQDPDLRIDLMGQMTYFLPHLLALSTSSPFWQGQDTGLASYRLTVFDNLPRTGLPPQFNSWAEYDRTVSTLVEIGEIEDSTKIWWDLRPSHRYPTLESRICDVPPRLEHSVQLAAATQCLIRMLWRLRRMNQRWRLYDRFLVGENRWRAQRFGATEGLIDFGQRAIVSIPDLITEMQELVAEDAKALGCQAEVDALPDLIVEGTSSERQRRAYTNARAAGKDDQAALQEVVFHLMAEFEQDL